MTLSQRSLRTRALLVVGLLLAATGSVLPGTLISVAPAGASPDVLVNVTGTGFSTIASQNIVTFTPKGGAARTASGTSVVTTNAATGTRRLSVRVPAGLPPGPAALSVRNTATGEVSTGTTLDVVTLALPDVRSGVAGAQGLAVRITGSSNAKFVAGTTRPAFGAGITVVSTTVQSPTSLVATINIAASAAPGSRSVSITQSTQSLLLANAFEVTAAPPPNRPPVANPNGPYSGTASVPLTFSSAGSADPDNDALTFAWTFGDGATSSDPNPTHTYASAGSYTVGLTVSDNRGGSHLVTTTALVAAPNRPPQISSSPVLTGIESEPYLYQVVASDPDGDALTYTLPTAPAGMVVSSSGAITWTPAAAQTGGQSVQVQVADGRGGIDVQSYSIQVAPAVTLSAIDVMPAGVRFTSVGETSALVVTGRRSDQSSIDLTAASSGTTYESSNGSVAQVSADGVVTATGNGTAIVTAHNGGFSDTAAITVEIGVLLESLELTPPVSTLRALAATTQTRILGSFSDGSVRDLTNSVGTTFSIGDGAVAQVSAAGLVTALGAGVTTVTARYEALSATAEIRVVIDAGSAFLRGEVFDDSRGIPLAGVTATLLGSGAAAGAALADDRGRYGLGAAAGPALVRVARAGFTSVDRRVDAPADAVTTLLDARLTPLDGRLNLLQSVFGGQASSTDGTATLQVPAGSLDSDAALRVTPISNQGLHGLLPAGWSPIAAVDLQPAGRQFTYAATLRLPHIDGLASGTEVVLARYDVDTRSWLVQTPGRVSDDRRTVSAAIDVTGQYAFLVPDEAPLPPPAAIPGQALAGVATPIVPDNATATGQVVPRSAPPGDDVRAVGTLVLQPPAPLPSGAVLRARVTEQFDLLDASRVRPMPFVQDLVLYARPRIGPAGSLATRLPIAPTLQFSLQQLSLGQVRLDVSVHEPGAEKSIVGPAGIALTDAAGNVLDISAGALAADVAIGLLPLSSSDLSASVPDGFTLVGGVLIDLVGAAFSQPVGLSIPRPSGLDPAAQIVVAQIVNDGAGGRRFSIVGLGQIAGTRVSVQTVLGTLTFDGIRGGGEFAFLRPTDPLGFVSGLVQSPGTVPQAHALVTADTAPFAAVTGATGTFVVAGRVGSPTTVSAIEPSGGAASGLAAITAANQVAALTLALQQTAPIVTATTPGANATNVALDSPIIVDFSKAIDPASITATSVTVSAGTASIAVQRVLSANRRRLTITPSSPLVGLTVYTLALTSEVRDTSSVPLATFVPQTFRTLDPSKAAPLALGTITAELPDEDGLVSVVGAPGSAEGGGAVAATNLRTQETSTVLASADGSFRLRIPAIVGDEIALTLRNADGRETTITIAQFSSPDGTTSIGEAGGTIVGAGGRLGRVLPRALATASVFKVSEASASPIPALPPQFAAADRFALEMPGATFRRLQSLTVSESQNRFAPAAGFSSPFAASGQLTVPPDFLVTASLRFTATVVDRDGVQRSAAGATTVVSGSPDVAAIESGFGDAFPSVFLTSPRQAIPLQVVQVTAVAPAARVEFDLPAASATPAGDSVILTRVVSFQGEDRLSLVDRLTRTDVGGVSRLRTSGRELPGATRPGDYAAVAGPMAFATGRVNGPAAIVAADGSPFIFETDGANGAFTLPVIAGAPFTLRIVDAATGAALGSVNGQAPPAGGALDLNQVLPPAGGTLSISVQPDASTIVDIDTPLVFSFSEALDRGSVTPGAFLITDERGVRAFGRITVSDDSRTVTFVPLRRWKYATRYTVGVATSLTAATGARMTQPFAGAFTTFAPRLIGSAAIGEVNDLAVSGSVALAATAAGAVVLDATRPDRPAIVSEIPAVGGASAVAIATEALADRNGQPVNPLVGVVAAGGGASVGTLRTFALTAPAAYQFLGATHVTTPPGPGAPSAVVLGAGGRAVVSLREAGVAAVALGTAIPDNPANPGEAITAHHPAIDAVQSALVGALVAVAGPSGLTVLDATTLNVVTSAPAGALTSVAGLPSFGFDVNADGRVDAASEVIDMVVAGDANGVLQFYRLGNGTLQLLSVVRLPAGASVGGIALSAEEGLAYVGAGARGLAFVDLRAGASVQPLDVDRDGVDDRLVAEVPMASAGRVVFVRARGTAWVASAAGLAAVQVLPPRTTFLSILRDPVRDITGDEQSLMTSRLAFTSDQHLLVTVNAAIPEPGDLSLSIEEVPQGSGARLLSFANGTLVAPLASGFNVLTLNVLADESSLGSAVVFNVRQAGGQSVSRFAFTIAVSDTAGLTLDDLIVGPPNLVLTAAAPSAQLSVAGQFSDGTYRNLSRPATGTTFASLNEITATVTSDGLVTGRAGGPATVLVANAGVEGSSGLIAVQLPPVMVAMSATRFVTLTRTGETRQLEVIGQFSDESSRSVADDAATVYSTSDASVALAAGSSVVAAGEGRATVTVSHGSIVETVAVEVMLRTPATADAVRLEPLPVVTTDQLAVSARASVIGTGSMDALTISFAIEGLGAIAPVLAQTDATGSATVTLSGWSAAGVGTVRATVTDPASTEVRSATQPLRVESAPADLEPNDTPQTAARLRPSSAIKGALSAADPLDVYRVSVAEDGTLVLLFSSSNPTAHSLSLLTDAGTTLATLAPTQAESRFETPIGAGAYLLQVRTSAGGGAYSLEYTHVQSSLVVNQVVPASGPPGTVVTIRGSGFSTELARNKVLFGGVLSEIQAASTSELRVIVPVAAVNGPLRIVVGTQQAEFGAFMTGTAGPLPASYAEPLSLSDVVADPQSGQLVARNRLLVRFGSSVARTEVLALVQPLGGVVLGYMPLDNLYQLGFSGASLYQLEATRRTLLSSPLVLDAFREVLVTLDGGVDYQAGGFERRWAFDLIKLADAYRYARAYREAAAARVDPATVSIGVMDSGLDLSLAARQNEMSGVTINVWDISGANDPPAALTGAATLADNDNHSNDHGTLVAMLLAQRNNGDHTNGVATGLFEPDETPSRVTLSAFKITSTGSDHTSSASTIAMLDKVATRVATDRTQIVNMSFGNPDADGSGGGLLPDIRPFTLRLGLMPNVLFVAAAGNQDRDAVAQRPSNLTQELANVISVAAVAPSGECGNLIDSRGDFEHGACAVFGNPASNFGTLNIPEGTGYVDLAAPSFNRSSIGTGPFRGTSSATPVVAGVAALLYQLEPFSTRLSRPECTAGNRPGCIKRILKETADDITETWADSPNLTAPTIPSTAHMVRLNAFAAVVHVLPVANQATDAFVSETGRERVLQVSLAGNLPTARPVNWRAGLRPQPTGSLVVAPDGQRAYVALRGTERLERAIGVISAPTGVLYRTIPIEGRQELKLAITPDGRLLFASDGRRIVVIDLHSETELTKLPKWTAAGALDGEKDVSFVMPACRFCLGSSTFGDMAVSPDGKVLYVVVRSGTGPGVQEGGVLALNIDLTRDAAPGVTGMQADPSAFLTVLRDFSARGRDEPQSISLSPDGRYLYLVHNGFEGFISFNDSEEVNRALADLIRRQREDGAISDADIERYRELARIAVNGGQVKIDAPGLIATFDTQAPQGPEIDPDVPRFSTDLSAQWGGLPLDERQVQFGARPSAIAMRPDGRRAIVTYFQTGNFGILDQDRQVDGPPDETFRAVLANTEAVPLNPHLWPVDPADEILLFPGAIQYDQWGRLAIATHRGTNSSAGALTLLRDQSLTDGLARATDTVDGEPYFKVHPICGPDDAQCGPSGSQPLRSWLFDTVAGESLRAPSAVAFRPDVSIVTPRSGEIVWPTSRVHLRARTSAAVDRLVFRYEARDGTNVRTGELPPRTGVTLNDQSILVHTLLGGFVPADGSQLTITVEVEHQGATLRSVLHTIYRTGG